MGPFLVGPSATDQPVGKRTAQPFRPRAPRTASPQACLHVGAAAARSSRRAPVRYSGSTDHAAGSYIGHHIGVPTEHQGGSRAAAVDHRDVGTPLARPVQRPASSRTHASCRRRASRNLGRAVVGHSLTNAAEQAPGSTRRLRRHHRRRRRPTVNRCGRALQVRSEAARCPYGDRRPPAGTGQRQHCRATSGFPISVQAHEPNTIGVVPIKSDSEHYPPDAKLRVLPQPDRRR